MQKDEFQEARRAIYRGVAHAALVWGVDRDATANNPVFWYDDALNYVSPSRADEEVFVFLRQRGIMSAGFNGAHRLNFTFEDLDEALDRDHSTGLDFEPIFGLLLRQFEMWDLFRFGHDAGPHFLKCTKERATEVRTIFAHLADLGYLMRTGEESSEQRYRWAPKAVPMVKLHLQIDIDLPS